MSYKVLRNNIKTLLDELVTAGTIAEVSTYPKFEYNGWPSAFVVPSGNEADYETNIEHQRIYGYKIWIMERLQEGDAPLGAAYDSLLDVAQSVINKIDRQEAPTVMSMQMRAGLPSYEHLTHVFATPGIVALDEQQQTLGIEITVQCRVIVALEEIS